MTVRMREFVDLACNAVGCRNELSEYSERVYADANDAREEAEAYDWTHTEDDRDLCPMHRPECADEEG